MPATVATYESKVAQRLSEAAGICLLGLTAMLALSLVSFDATDPSWFNVSSTPMVRNMVGEPGAFASAILLHLLGLAAWVPVSCLAVLAGRMILGRSTHGRIGISVGFGLMISAGAGILDMVLDSVVLGGSTTPAGGLLGAELARTLRSILNTQGAATALATALLVGLVLFTQVSAARVVVGTRGAMTGAVAHARVRVLHGLVAYRKERKRREVIRRHAEEIREEVERSRRDVPPPTAMAVDEAAVVDESAPSKRATASPPVAVDPATTRARRKRVIRERVAGFMGGRESEPPPAATVGPARGAAAEQLELPVPPIDDGGSPLPPLALLKTPDGEIDVNEKELFEKGKALEAKFGEFSVSGSVTQIHPGPVVTTFEYKPDPGIKISRLTSLADDLCLALKAESIRIDRIAGKSTVGIEVPNARREIIYLRDILQSDVWKASSSPLTIALGKLINGEPYVTDLARMPHLLIAGSTGAGKSVSLHAMIASILYRATPDEVRFVMIDPKTVELAAYDGIPHLLCPVVVDPKLASNALKWAIREMERRYKMLARFGVRSIDQLNSILKTAGKGGRHAPKLGAVEAEAEETKPLPYIVVIIDELADLMMVSSADVEEGITRLAQMARAVGIHLILATQRPSVDVITGVIKANFPSRISFRVATKTDSRTILDANGAEQLLGRGDMLFLPPGSSRLVRVHSPFITEREADGIANYLKRRGQPVYDEAVTKPVIERPESAVEAEREDGMYFEAIRLVVRTGSASVSSLQRKLRLGYSRAARLVDLMEDDGIVSAADGARPRQVLISPKEYEIRFGGREG